MASPFRIPKKKQPAGSDSAPLYASPLSRLQRPDPDPQGFGDPSSRVHAGNSTQRRALVANVVKTMLGLNSPPANHRAAPSSQSQNGQGAESPWTWRPKRASDRLLPADSPPKKTKDPHRVAVASLDLLAGLREEVHAGTTKGSSSRRRNLDRSVLRRPRPCLPEPIVLSSEDEDGRNDEDDEDEGQRTSLEDTEDQASRDQTDPLPRPPPPLPRSPPSLPPVLELDFSSLHAGLTHANANGKMMVSEHGVFIPLKGVEEGEVTVVASQVRGYGVWDGAVAQDGLLLAGWEGPAPSLLFLWVTDAQANLLQRELTPIQTQTPTQTSGPACCFLLLVLKEQLQELQVALLTSILDMEEYKSGSSSSSGPTSPLDWTDGLLLLHSCAPPPLDQHLLKLLGHSSAKTNQKNKTTKSPRLQRLPTRLIQYPAPPHRGRITVTSEDLACLDSGQFLNDVIIDFYLKFLLLEGGGSAVGRSHVFSSFFYKQLSRRRAAGDHEGPSVPDRHSRHQRVKTWTRHVDIFTKDFLFVPVNQESHWFLVVICFPGLEEVHYEDFQSPAGSQRPACRPEGRPLSSRTQNLPDCTELSCQRDTVMKRSCILVLDSLKLSHHDNVCRLLREYLQVEWEVRRAKPRLFTPDRMKSCTCRVPQQDNSSDCGLYLLQYAETFLQNPVVHFELPVRLENWFPRQRVRQKRDEIRALILRIHKDQNRNQTVQT